MGDILPPPSTNVPAIRDQEDPRRRLDFTNVWRQWFIDLAAIINKSGGVDGAVPTTRTFNTGGPLSGGGDLTEDLTLDFVPAGADGDVQINDGGVLGSVAGVSITIPLAKLTTPGIEGSLTFTNGILTAYEEPT